MTNKIAKAPKVNVKANGSEDEKYIFRLFVTGLLPNSARAIKNTNEFCEQYVKGRYDLEIIDIYQQPLLAVSEEIIAVPLLIKKFPLPEVRMVGDMSDIEKALKELDLK